MIIFFLAGAAVLEVHRALHRSHGDPDVEAMQKRESELKAALEAAQRELSAEKEQRQQAQGTADVLSAANADLQAQTASLRAENDELADQSKLLLRRFAALEESAATLQTANDGLLQQVEALKLESEAEVSRTLAQLEELRAEVASAVRSWSDGDITAEVFVAKMADLGVEVHCAPGSLPALPAPQQLKPGAELQLTVDATWTSKMQLVTDSKERMSRLLAAATARENGLPPRSAGALTFPAVKTPPRDAGMSRRLDMSGFCISGLTPRGSRADSQALLDVMAANAAAEVARTAAPLPAATKQAVQPLQSIENIGPASQQGNSLPKPKVDKKGGKRLTKNGIPKLEFAAFDSDEHFGSNSGRDLLRL